ncbi:hypothetical protein V2J09_012195 [Rumex salicifolius]
MHFVHSLSPSSSSSPSPKRSHAVFRLRIPIPNFSPAFDFSQLRRNRRLETGFVRLMGTMICMNILCGTTASAEWKRGWILRSGEAATLCYNCGYAYEQQTFCETFHGDETGWRHCVVCGKQLHCGCVSSLPFIEMLDNGGVKCVNCARNGSSSESGTGAASTVEIKHLNTHEESKGVKDFGTNGVLGLMKPEDGLHPPLELGHGVMLSSYFAQSPLGLPHKKALGLISSNVEAKDFGAFISLGGPISSSQPFHGTSAERKDHGSTSSFQKVPPSCNILPKTVKPSLSSGFHSNINIMPHMRIARPPVEGRGRNQLLPRYWPRITEQELQQISGDPNCTIVPLFEKVLSASDAGRIGRLVLPKACAEAYFPPISQPEGLPLKIQDVKGKDWVFQFRFWPNNNSRMYVLEGVTPCIQSMQLQAGDTVIFSRMDPEGKLVMGFRKASTSVPLQSLKVSTDCQVNGLPNQVSSAGGNIMWNNNDKQGLSSVLLERKISRNIGLKSKRLQIDSQEVVELKLTWEEVQDMLRAPDVAKPNIVTEPPVFGKTSIFSVRSSGMVEQWTQCDACLKWRRLPIDVLLPAKWTCGENIWDESRCSCSAPDEMGPMELEMFLQLTKDFKKRKVAASNRMMSEEQESAGLEALANASASFGDNTSEPGASSSFGAATTKHPRHRPGCSCIVCIQPPSGKGKHKPSCNCNVCLTVKRRFKTLMMRKKKRQSDQEAELLLARKTHQTDHRDALIDEAEVDSRSPPLPSLPPQFDTEATQSSLNGKELDLNFHPEGNVSMTSLLQLASLPLEIYMKQNGLTSLASEQQISKESESSVDEDELDDQPPVQEQGQASAQCQ